MAILTAADRTFDELLRQRFGAAYLGWTGVAYRLPAAWFAVKETG